MSVPPRRATSGEQNQGHTAIPKKQETRHGREEEKTKTTTTTNTHTHGESNAGPPSTTARTPWRKPHRQLGLLCTNLEGRDDCILVFLNSLVGKLGCGQQTHALQCKIPGRHTNIPKDMYTQAKKCPLRHVHIKKKSAKNLCTHKKKSAKICTQEDTYLRTKKHPQDV